jgi:hypothetical protein
MTRDAWEGVRIEKLRRWTRSPELVIDTGGEVL